MTEEHNHSVASNEIRISMDDVLGPDGLDGAWEGMCDRLASRAASCFEQSAGRMFNAAAGDAIKAGVQRALEEHVANLMNQPIQPTDGFGNPKGDPTTFVEMIGAAVADAKTERVDYDGKPTPHGKYTLLQHAIKRVAVAEISTAVKEELRKINQEAKKAVAAEVARSVAANIK